MNILTLNSTILAVDPVDDGGNWVTVDQIIPKHVVEGAVIVNAAIPDDFVTSEYEWDGVQVVKKPVVAPPVPVPESVSKAQGKAALIHAGLWPAVTSYIAAIADPVQKALAEVALNDTQEWRRDSPFLNAAAAALGMSDAELDVLFVAAAKVTF